MKIDSDVRKALETRASRGQDPGTAAVWARAMGELQHEPTDSSEDAVVVDLVQPAPPSVERGKLAWLAAVASFIAIIGGAALIASGITGQSTPADSNPASNLEPAASSPDVVLHFAGTAVEPWRALDVEPTTFVVDTSFGVTSFSILYSSGPGADIELLGDLVPPSTLCAETNSCIDGQGTIVADQIGMVNSVVDEVRLVERTDADGNPQTTAIFVLDEDVVRLVGECDTQCVRIGLEQLRVGDATDVEAPAGRRSTAPGRILLGVFFLVMGAITWLNLRRSKNPARRPPNRAGWLSIVTHQEWDEIESRQSKDEDPEGDVSG